VEARGVEVRGAAALVENWHEEQSCISLAAAGDPEAFGWLYERYQERIYRFVLLRLGNLPDAEDVTEQIFLKMIERISSFTWRGPGSFAAWLYRIAYNQVVDAVRAGSHESSVQLGTEHRHLKDEESDPHQHAERQEFLSQVKAVMVELTDLQAQVILLRYGAELSIAETAEVLDRTPGTVTAVQHQALRKLRGLMALKGYKHL
jgi:RNA polymerase sigma-70 factor, ECF subfamily